MTTGKEKIIPIFALIIILVGIFSTIYVHGTNIDKDTIKINGKDYTMDQLFSMGEISVIETDEGKKTGIALDDLVLKVGVGCPQCVKYTIKAKDKYQQTVDWDIMKTGILTDYSRVYFPDTAHSFWVSNVIEIEVK